MLLEDLTVVVLMIMGWEKWITVACPVDVAHSGLLYT